MTAGDSLLLAPNFTLAEALTSRSFPDLQYAPQRVPQRTLVNAVRLAAALQVFRGFYGNPIVVNSWIRSPELNAAVGGASKSRHMFGVAVDFTVSRVVSSNVFAAVKSRRAPMPFDRLAFYETTGHLHADLSPDPTIKPAGSLYIVTSGKRWERQPYDA